MSFVISGRRAGLGRVVSHVTAMRALSEICRMERAGYSDVEVRQPYMPPTPGPDFVTGYAATTGPACAHCPESCPDRAAV